MSDPIHTEADQLTNNATHGMEFAETAEHYADMRTRIRASIGYQIVERNRARELASDMRRFLESTNSTIPGRIVSAHELTTHQIAEAKSTGRFFADPESGLGWALVPWVLTTQKDVAREHGFDSIDKALPRKFTEDGASL